MYQPHLYRRQQEEGRFLSADDSGHREQKVRQPRKQNISPFVVKYSLLKTHKCTHLTTVWQRPPERHTHYVKSSKLDV